MFTLNHPPMDFPSIIYILGNMVIGFILFAVILFFYNLIAIKYYGPLFNETSGSLLQKINVMISSRRISSSEVASLKHEDPAEIYTNGLWVLFTPIFQSPLDDEAYEKIETEAREQAANDVKVSNRSYLWVRPQPPGLVFIMFAYIFWIIFGSPLVSIFGS